MAALTAARSFNNMVTDTTQVRDVSEQMVLLEPDANPLFVITNAAKRKSPSIAPRFEWIEDQEVALWGQVSNGSDYSNSATGIQVLDVTLFAVGDLIASPKAVTSSSADEVMLVTAITGNTLTVTRDIGTGGVNDTIGQTSSIKIIGTAFTENGAISTNRFTAKTVQVSYCQIFKTLVQITHTAASTKQYGASQGERKYQLVKSMIRHRSEIEAAGLWSRASESLASPGSRWTTMGLKPRISTNKTDSSTTLTLTVFNTFGESVFRYGESQKFLMAAPKIISAINFFSQNKLLTSVGDTVFGVKINRLTLGLGELLLKNNYRMSTSEVGYTTGNNFSDEAYAIDLPSVAMRYLSGGGDNLIGDTKLYENIVQDGSTVRSDEYRSQVGWEIRHEKKHGRLFDVTAYA